VAVPSNVTPVRVTPVALEQLLEPEPLRLTVLKVRFDIGPTMLYTAADPVPVMFENVIPVSVGTRLVSCGEMVEAVYWVVKLIAF
jgi:hypothetical protein